VSRGCPPPEPGSAERQLPANRRISIFRISIEAPSLREEGGGKAGRGNELAEGGKQFWMRIAGEGGGPSADQCERYIQKLIDAGCYRVPNGKGIVRPDGVIQVIDLQPDAPGWNNNRGFGRRFGFISVEHGNHFFSYFKISPISLPTTYPDSSK
jgi:hypothetical protein